MRIARAHTQVTYKNIINITTNIERVFFWWVCSAASTVQTKLNQFVWAFVTLHLMVDCSHFRWEYTRESTEQMKYTSIDRIWFRIIFFLCFCCILHFTFWISTNCAHWTRNNRKNGVWIYHFVGFRRLYCINYYDFYVRTILVRFFFLI